MILRRHRRARDGRQTTSAQTAPEAPVEPTTPTDESPRFDDLTDEQVLEAYVTTLPEGEATERDEQVVELRAVAAFAHEFDTEPEATEPQGDDEPPAEKPKRTRK